MLSKNIKKFLLVACTVLCSTSLTGCSVGGSKIFSSSILDIDKNQNPPLLEDYNIKSVDEVDETVEVE